MPPREATAQVENDFKSNIEAPFNPEAMTLAEIEEVVKLCDVFQSEYKNMQGKGKKRLLESQLSGTKKMNGDKRIPAYQRNRHDLIPGMENSKQTERRVIAIYEHRKKIAGVQGLYQSTIRTIALRLTEDPNEIIERFAPSGICSECYYPEVLAEKVRAALLELMCREVPVGNVRWKKEALNPEVVSVGAVQAIAEFLQKKGCGKFTEIIDEKGDLIGYCSAETVKYFEAVWNQIKIQPNYVHVDLFVNDINKGRNGKKKINADEVLALAKQFAVNDPTGLRPAFHIKHGVTSTFSTSLSIKLKQHLSGKTDLEKKWLTIKQIKDLYGVDYGSNYLLKLFKDAGAELGVDVEVFKDGENPRVNYYSEAFVEDVMAKKEKKKVKK